MKGRPVRSGAGVYSLIGSLLMAGALGAAEASFNPLNQRL